MSRVPIKQKSLGTTVVLAILIFGLGHFYLGFKLRGALYLILGTFFVIVVTNVAPSAALYGIFLWWLVQLVDAITCQKRLNAAWQRQYTGYRK